MSYKLIIAGGRDFKDYERMATSCDIYIARSKKFYTLASLPFNIEIVCGMAPGADTLGLKYAKERGYTWKEFPAPWDDIEGKPAKEIRTRRDGSKYWTKAGPYRNDLMARYANRLIAFWDGKSSGTADMILAAHRYGLHVMVVTY